MSLRRYICTALLSLFGVPFEGDVVNLGVKVKQITRFRRGEQCSSVSR